MTSQHIVFRPRAIPAVRPSAGRAHSRSRGRILCFGHVMPYPPHAGNAYRIQMLVRWLMSEGWDVLLVACPQRVPTESEIIAAAEIYPNLVVCCHDGTVWHSAEDVAQVIDGLAGRRASGIPSLLRERETAEHRVVGLTRVFCPDILVELLRRLDRSWRPDVHLAEYVFMTRAFPALRRCPPKIIDTLDAYSTIPAKLGPDGLAAGPAMTEAEEGTLLRRGDAIIAIQPEEANLFSRLAPASKVVTVGVDFSVPTTVVEASHPTVLVVGYDNLLNARGLQDFLRLAWPEIRRKVPAAELRIAGLVGRAVTCPPDGVRVLGAMEDLGPEYRNARVVINPTDGGTGLKIKTIEALSQMRPVVAWPSGVEGVATKMRSLCRIANSWDEFAAHVVTLLTEPLPGTVLDAHRKAVSDLVSPAAVYAPLREVLAEFEGLRTRFMLARFWRSVRYGLGRAFRRLAA